MDRRAAHAAHHVRGVFALRAEFARTPGCSTQPTFALAYAGWSFADQAWAINEHSSISADGPPIYPFKTIIPIAGALLLLQGIVEIVRCVACIQQGEWPSRTEDVEEVDVDKLKEMVHVKDEDIAALDQLVVAHEHGQAQGAAK
jgi:hypothetical protein